MGYNGQVEVLVTVTKGLIASVTIDNHVEKQFYSSLEDTPANIVRLQNINGVDATTGATITSNAVILATGKALSAAR